MRLPLCCCLLLIVAGTRGQDDSGFDLSDAIGPDELKPTSKPQPGPGDDALDDLGVLGFGDTGGAAVVPKKPTPKPPPVVPAGGGGGDDYVLGFGDTGGAAVVPKKPTPKPPPVVPAGGGGGGDEGGFNLEDAFGGDDTYKPVKPHPGQGGGGGGGTFGDDDLLEPGMPHDSPSDHDNRPKGRASQPSSGGEEQGQEGNQSMLAGIVSTVAVAAVGAVSSFIAYQKKKLCFKGAATDDPENVNMDSHKGDQSEPQVQSTLLAK
ncbi:CD99 antigen isoform X3 [Ranitomeya variabilis]|uniref:CD99 antigen isoform X3 n=1 Tax=Ranitomeya variabilis TaxID=490064 RepID=UPI004056979A